MLKTEAEENMEGKENLVPKQQSEPASQGFQGNFFLTKFCMVLFLSSLYIFLLSCFIAHVLLCTIHTHTTGQLCFCL